jgi:phospholipase C
MSQGEKQITNPLDTFDHVVVLMLENRSFDSLLGYLYSQQYPVPSGKQFDGLDGKTFSNPIPKAYHFTDKNGKLVTEVPAGRIDKDVELSGFSPPFPDPGEDYPHVNTQLFNTDNALPYNKYPYNLPSSVGAPPMTGFVSDYIQNYIKNEYKPGHQTPPLAEFYQKYKYIMESYDPADVPVLSGLAREFAVFDHWFCSVPSETICNRNFWHAGTSWGHVINPGPKDDPDDDDNQSNTEHWLIDTGGPTLFSQMATKDWKIYSDNRVPISAAKNVWLPVTPFLHLLNLAWLYIDGSEQFHTIEDFKNDCANGTLPAYSFLEPNFFDPHNDMHPSTPGETIDGGPQKVSPVLLGDALVLEIYNAIFTAPQSQYWDNTLLIITFDEHGGCYDHVPPPGQYGQSPVDPTVIATPPELRQKWDKFDFNRLGLRVPMVMVSPYIKQNTIINTPMSHTSFLKTIHEKWSLLSLSAREDNSPCFHDSGLLSTEPRLKSDMPKFTAPVIPADDTDYSKALMSALAEAIMSLVKKWWDNAFPDERLLGLEAIRTHQEAAAFFSHAIPRAKAKLRRLDAVGGPIHERDGVLIFQAIAEEMRKKGPL